MLDPSRFLFGAEADPMPLAVGLSLGAVTCWPASDVRGGATLCCGAGAGRCLICC